MGLGTCRRGGGVYLPSSSALTARPHNHSLYAVPLLAWSSGVGDLTFRIAIYQYCCVQWKSLRCSCC